MKTHNVDLDTGRDFIWHETEQPTRVVRAIHVVPGDEVWWHRNGVFQKVIRIFVRPNHPKYNPEGSEVLEIVYEGGTSELAFPSSLMTIKFNET